MDLDNGYEWKLRSLGKDMVRNIIKVVKADNTNPPSGKTEQLDSIHHLM